MEPIAQFLPKHAIIVEVDGEGALIQSLHGTSKVNCLLSDKQRIEGIILLLATNSNLCINFWHQVHHISEITYDNERKFAYLGSPYNTQIWKLAAKDVETAERKIIEMNLG